MAERALPRRLRRLLLQFKAEFDPVSATYETTACALDGLEAALDVDFPYSKRKRKYAAVSAGGVRKLGWTWLGCCMTFTRSTTAAVAEPPGSMTLTRSTTAAAAETPGSLCADLSLTFRILNTAALTIIAIACLVWLRTPRPTPPSRAMTPTPPPTDAGDQPDSSASAGAAAAAPDGSASAGGVQPDDSASAGAASMKSKVVKKLHVLYDRLDKITSVLGRHMFYRDDVLLTLMLCKTDVGEIAQLVEERMVILPDAPQELAHDDTAPQEPAKADAAWVCRDWYDDASASKRRKQ